MGDGVSYLRCGDSAVTHLGACCRVHCGSGCRRRRARGRGHQSGGREDQSPQGFVDGCFVDGRIVDGRELDGQSAQEPVARSQAGDPRQGHPAEREERGAGAGNSGSAAAASVDGADRGRQHGRRAGGTAWPDWGSRSDGSTRIYRPGWAGRTDGTPWAGRLEGAGGSERGHWACGRSREARSRWALRGGRGYGRSWG